MPIYEYKSSGSVHCQMCRKRFEIRQRMSDEPLRQCPECGAPVERVLSKSYVCMIDPLSQAETFETHTEAEAEAMGLEGGFAPDEIWE